MWASLGARSWVYVLRNETQNFPATAHKPLIAVRNSQDFNFALETADKYTLGFDIEYEKTLRYVISELLYNTLEHGQAWLPEGVTNPKRCPSLIQLTWYASREEISIIVADLGVGIKSHLERAYPSFQSHIDALRFAIRPQVSGTFGVQSAYSGKNNAGVGLYFSSNIVRRLNADMYLISGNGLLHISPRDITSRQLGKVWPGTIALVNIRLSSKPKESLHSVLQYLRDEAKVEIEKFSDDENNQRHYLSVINYFGRYADNKMEAISYRDKHLVAAVHEGKEITIDFKDVISAPHSFLSALLATPIGILGMVAYKRIRIINAVPEIRETIDFILDENTSGR